MKRSAMGSGVVDEVDPVAAAPRALLVESGTAAVRALCAALAQRGFAVETARDPVSALRRLCDDVEGFELLVACVATAHEGGDALVRTVRRGGESALAVVVVTGADRAAALERAGADAVLDGSLGADLIARASLEVVARKRERSRG